MYPVSPESVNQIGIEYDFMVIYMISITISITPDELTRSTRSIKGNSSYITISCSGSCGSVGRAAFFCQPLLHLKNGCNKWQVQTGNDCLLSLKNLTQPLEAVEMGEKVEPELNPKISLQPRPDIQCVGLLINRIT